MICHRAKQRRLPTDIKMERTLSDTNDIYDDIATVPLSVLPKGTTQRIEALERTIARLESNLKLYIKYATNQLPQPSYLNEKEDDDGNWIITSKRTKD